MTTGRNDYEIGGRGNPTIINISEIRAGLYM